jgi:hypothetical protein
VARKRRFASRERIHIPVVRETAIRTEAWGCRTDRRKNQSDRHRKPLYCSKKSTRSGHLWLARRLVARERKSRDAVSSYGKKFKPQIILSAVRLLAGNRVGARRSRDTRILFQRRHGHEESAKTSGKGQECPNHAALWRKGRVRSSLSVAHINFVISNAINSSHSPICLTKLASGCSLNGRL